MWKDEIKKAEEGPRYSQEKIDAMDFAESVLARIESLLDKRRKNLTKDQRMELRYYLKDLYLKAE